MTINVRPPSERWHPGYNAGRYYGGSFAAGTSTGATISTGTVYYIPFVVFTAGRFDRICFRYTTASGSAGSLARCGIYTDNRGVPGSLIIDGGTFATDTAAVAAPEITISAVSLGAGLYWVALIEDTNSGANAWSPILFAAPVQGGNDVTGAIGGSGGQAGRTEVRAFGALPATATPSAYVHQTPLVALRAA
jgi:hypothetical protein